MGRFVRTVGVPVRPKVAYRNFLNNWGFLLSEHPDVHGATRRARGTNSATEVTVLSADGVEGRFDVEMRAGWRWSTPLSFTTGPVNKHDLPASYRPATGTVTVRAADGGAEVEVVVEIDQVADDDPGVAAMLDQGAQIVTTLLPKRRVAWY